MSEKKCKGCSEYILPEDSGFGGGKSAQSTGRCRISKRIVRRMSECPLDDQSRQRSYGGHDTTGNGVLRGYGC